ncbi:MAG: TIGR02253 family HAD-type hydrolase [Candidatus Helarchaeota archaeon]
MIKALIFDLDDTLFDSTRLAEKARRAGIRAILNMGFNLEITEDECYKILLEVIEEFGSNYSYHFDQLIKRIGGISKLYSMGIGEYMAVKGMIPPPKMFVQAAVIAYHNVKFKEIKPFDDVIPFFEKIKHEYTSIKISILTDGLPDKQYEKILRLGLHEYLNDIIISDEVGVRKPNVKLYKLALERLGMSPEEVIYVGDHYETDIIPPLKLGIHAVYIHRGGKYDIKISREPKPEYEIHKLDELIKIIKDLNSK